MLIIYSVHVCLCSQKTELGREGSGWEVMGKLLAEVPCGKAGKSVAIQVDDVRKRLLILGALNPWSPKALGSSL